MAAIVMGTREAPVSLGLLSLPDELLLRILQYLDIPELLQSSRISHRLRSLSLDPLLHQLRLRYSHTRIAYLLPRRPALQSLQPPLSAIYLTRTHLTARRLHWSLVCIRLNRSLSRRPKLSTLVSANILPKECCRYDRRSGEILWGQGIAGALIERKRRIEREHLRDGLRVWLDRKADQIRARQKDAAGGVGVLVWRFSRKTKVGEAARLQEGWPEEPKKERVSSLRKFWENIGEAVSSR